MFSADFIFVHAILRSINFRYADFNTDSADACILVMACVITLQCRLNYQSLLAAKARAYLQCNDGTNQEAESEADRNQKYKHLV